MREEAWIERNQREEFETYYRVKEFETYYRVKEFETIYKESQRDIDYSLRKRELDIKGFKVIEVLEKGKMQNCMGSIFKKGKLQKTLLYYQDSDILLP